MLCKSRIGIPAGVLFALMAAAAALPVSADPTVSSVRAAQLPDKRVEVLYNLSGVTGNGAVVTIRFSDDGGSTYTITPAAGALSGDIGTVSASGSDKWIVWDAAATLPAGTYNENFKAAVTAADAGGGGDEITVYLGPGNTVPLTLVRIPAGTFQMGAYEDEESASSDEFPQHQVTISHDYYMGVTEVTQEQWEAIMGSNPAHDYGVGPEYPVYYVSWNDIAGSGGFVEKLNQHLTNTGQPGAGRFRLPTEAEWERACRAGTTTRFSHGDALDAPCDEYDAFCELHDTYMWWGGNNDPYGSKPVGSKTKNPFGLYDMHGNLWEWVQDWYDSDYYEVSHSMDPTGPSSGSSRVARGGRWGSFAQYCRSAYRGNYPSIRSILLGFRLARSE